MAYSLIVKGKPQDALEAAQARGIKARVRSCTARETILEVEDFTGIGEWFSDAFSPVGAPFPVGTLLYYREI